MPQQPDPSTATTTPATTPVVSLDEGPLHDALRDLRQADVAIAAAEEDKRQRQQALGRVLREQLALVGEDDEDLQRQAVEVVATLYWDHRDVRVADLTAATGLSAARLRGLAGPRTTQLPCVDCGTPTTAVLTSRSSRPCVQCAVCRAAWEREQQELWFRPTVEGPYDDGWFDDPPSWPDPGTTAAPSLRRRAIGADTLRLLFDHLAQVLPDHPCDNGLTHTRTWARREGIDLDLLIDVLEARGGFCDCEVLLNVAGG